MKSFKLWMLVAVILVGSVCAMAQSAPLQTDGGVKAYQTYDGVRENIALAMGNVNLQLPLLSLPGRNGHDFNLSLTYNSQLWNATAYTYGQVVWMPSGIGDSGSVGIGWRRSTDFAVTATGMASPNIGGTQYFCAGGYVARLGDGALHSFSTVRTNCNQICPPPPSPPERPHCDGLASFMNVPAGLDDSGDHILLDTDRHVLVFKDGAQIAYHGGGVVDANGNVVTVGGGGVIDTVGRNITYNSSSTGLLSSIAYLDSNGTSRTIALQYISLPLNCTFSLPTTNANIAVVTQPSGSVTMLSAVVLPNGLSYTFQYSGCAELSKITYPGGGYTRYEYGSYAHSVSANAYPNLSATLHEVIAKHVCRAATTPAGATTAPPGNSCPVAEDTTLYVPTAGTWNNSSNSVTDPLGNLTTYQFTQGTDTVNAAHETSRTIYQGSSTILRTVQTAYASSITVPLRYPISQTTILPNGLQSQIQWDYQSYGFPWDPVTDNVTEQREYDYGQGAPGPLLRRTVNTWLTVGPGSGSGSGGQTPIDYALSGLNIWNRKTSEKIYDGAGTLLAQTTYEYDNYRGGIAASGAVQHGIPANSYGTPANAYGSDFTTRGNVTAVNRWRNTDGAWLATTYQYDDSGNVVSATDPMQHTTSFGFADSWGDTSCVTPSGAATAAYKTLVTNALGHQARSKYNSCTGTVASATDRNNQMTTFSYDLMDRLTAQNSPDGGQTSTCFSDTAGASCYSSALPIQVVSSSKIAASSSKVSTAVLDGLGHVTQTQLNSDPAGTDYVDVTYDGLERQVAGTNPHRAASAGTDGTTPFQYDALDRLTQVTKQDGSISTVSYLGNCTMSTDEAGKSRKVCTDGLGRPTNVWEDPSGLNYETDYQFDALGNLLRVDQKGSAPNDSSKWRTRLFTYNSLSQLLTAYNPESGTISYSYDADGELLQKTSPQANQNGSATTTISFCYDALHRVTGRAYTPQTCPLTNPVATYAYDAGTNGKGHLTSLTDQAGSGSYNYDAVGRLSSETRTIAGVTKSMSYAYHLDSSIASIFYPSGAELDYAYDSAGRPISAVDPEEPIGFAAPCPWCPAPPPITFNYVTNASYGPDGALTGFVSGASPEFSFTGITSTFTYNKRLQPVNMSASSPSQTVFSLGYDFHVGDGSTGADNGNVWGITNYKDNTRSQSFTYDQLNRLTSAQNTGTDCTQTVLGSKTKFWGNNYGYDAWGNLLSKTVTKCGAENLSVVAGNDNRLQGGYLYDAAGNMTHDATSGLNYSFDQENRITGAGGFTYTYDSDGNRVKKTDGSTGTLYWYMALGVVGESDLSGAMKSEYVFFGGERVARRDLVEPEGVFYYFSDHLKTTNIVTDARGNIENESDFYPWGGELQFLANDSNHYKFTGKERDVESGLDYFGARYYSNGLGRFTSVDPRPALSFQQAGDEKSMAKFQKMLANPQTWNMYAYCLDNPLRFTDPSGETVIANEQQANDEIAKRKLQEQRAQLTNYAKDLAKQVGAGKLDANKALDMFYNKAAALTKNTSDALLIAVGSSLDIRHATMDLNGSPRNVGNVLTANSLGIDSLHHFAFAAFNTYDNWWAPAAGIANYMVGLEDGPPYSRADGSNADVIADVAGAYFGQDLSKNTPNPLQPSAKIPFGKQWLNELEHPVEKQGGVVK